MIDTKEQLRLHDIIDSLKERLKMWQEAFDKLCVEKSWDCKKCNNSMGFYAPLSLLPPKMNCPKCGLEMILRGEPLKQS